MKTFLEYKKNVNTKEIELKCGPNPEDSPRKLFIRNCVVRILREEIIEVDYQNGHKTIKNGPCKHIHSIEKVNDGDDSYKFVAEYGILPRVLVMTWEADLFGLFVGTNKVK